MPFKLSISAAIAVVIRLFCRPPDAAAILGIMQALPPRPKPKPGRPLELPELEIVALFVPDFSGEHWVPIKWAPDGATTTPWAGLPRPMCDCDQLIQWSNGCWEHDSPAGRRVISGV